MKALGLVAAMTGVAAGDAPRGQYVVQAAQLQSTVTPTGRSVPLCNLSLPGGNHDIRIQYDGKRAVIDGEIWTVKHQESERVGVERTRGLVRMTVYFGVSNARVSADFYLSRQDDDGKIACVDRRELFGSFTATP